MPIYDKVIRETPVSFIDFETTGLVKGFDRVIEVAIVRMNPGKDPELVFDSLVNPGRKVTGTSIHGITDEDVANAPDFRDIAGDVVNAISGSVLSSYNVYFDVPFLEYELSRMGIKALPPYFCMMYMRPLLDLGKKCKLENACKEHGILFPQYHVASADVLATAQLFRIYLEILKSQGINTFGDLADLKEYKYFESFDNVPIKSPESVGLMTSGMSVSRSAERLAQHNSDEESRRIASYWDLLKTVVADLIVTEDELHLINEEKKRLKLKPEYIKAMHSKIFAGIIAHFIDDEFLSDEETKKLKMLWDCLDKLGWAPGQDDYKH